MISFEERIREIRAASTLKDAFHDPEVQRQVANIHGVIVPERSDEDDASDEDWEKRLEGMPNDCGVFTKGEVIKLEGVESNWCSAEIRIVQTPVGHWLMDISCQIHYSGQGAAPSIWNRQGYESREEAINAGLDKLHVIASNHIANEGREGEATYAKRGREMIDLIEDYRMKQNQLTLF